MNVDVVIPNEQIHITHLFSSVAFKKVKMHLINSYGKNDFVQDQNEMLNFFRRYTQCMTLNGFHMKLE